MDMHSSILLMALVVTASESADNGSAAGRAEYRAPDYTRLARSLVRSPHNPVLKVGPKGTWNDQTLVCSTVLADGDTFYLYSDGARFGKPKNIGMATSKDGIHWTWYEKNPLFGGSMPYAIKVGDSIHLYHSGGHAGLDEKPSRGDKYRVRVSAFYIDKFKVTNEDYCRFLNDGNEAYASPWNPRIVRSALDPNVGKFVPADRSHRSSAA